MKIMVLMLLVPNERTWPLYVNVEEVAISFDKSLTFIHAFIHHLFIQQVFIEPLLPTRHCSRH